MTNALFFIAILILIVGFAITIYFLTKKKEPTQDNQSFILMQNQLKDLRETLDLKLSDSQKQLHAHFADSQSRLQQHLTDSQRQMQTQFGQSADIIKGVTAGAIVG